MGEIDNPLDKVNTLQSLINFRFKFVKHPV